MVPDNKHAHTRIIAQSELNRLAQQLQDLREALAPFARFAESLPPVIPGVPRITDEAPIFVASPHGENFVITCADLRRAYALLVRLEEEDRMRVQTQVERNLVGMGDYCLHCRTLLEGAGERALNGFCSEVCEKQATDVCEAAVQRGFF